MEISPVKNANHVPNLAPGPVPIPILVPDHVLAPDTDTISGKIIMCDVTYIIKNKDFGYMDPCVFLNFLKFVVVYDGRQQSIEFRYTCNRPPDQLS